MSKKETLLSHDNETNLFLIEKYLEIMGFVNHHIESFNFFINSKM